MKTTIHNFKRVPTGLFRTADIVARQKAVETIAYETEGLEHIFALLVCGHFVGMPSPPVHLTMELLPEMDAEIRRMLDKVIVAHDPMGELFSVLGVD